MIDERLKIVVMKRAHNRLHIPAGTRLTITMLRALTVVCESSTGIIYEIPRDYLEPLTLEARRLLAYKPRYSRVRFTDEVRKKLLAAIRAGNYITPACVFAGIARTTFDKWMTDPAYEDFQEEVKQAEAEAEAQAVALIYQAGQRDPELFFRFLARRFPERWGDKKQGEAMQQRKLELELRKLEREEATAGTALTAPPPDSEAFKAELRKIWGFDRSGVKKDGT